MNQDRTKRKLSAIFSADVVGYSRLMEADEAWTIKSLEENKSLISNLIEDYHGRVIDAPGDNILAEFSSITNAVECAVKVQQELKKKNANIVENRRMEFRIGINLGEIVEEGGKIYGSGVNIAARIEGLSKSGGICISGRTYDHIKSKFDYCYEYLGEHDVKNISEPIRAYRVLMEPEAAKKVIGEKKPTSRTSNRIAMTAIIILVIIAAGSIIWNILSRKTGKMVTITEQTPKSIAVLPFVNLSSDPEQVYFVDGLSEEILNSLAQIPNLNVTGRTSSFSFKGSNKKVQEIANELGVENILEGSVRKAGNALRITAQLLRGADGFHLWSKTYDRELKDIFEVQEDIATSVADELRVTFGIDRSYRQFGGTDNMEAYELYLVALGRFRSGELTLGHTLEILEAALELDPKFSDAWKLKMETHIEISSEAPAKYSDTNLDAALIAAQKVIELGPNLPAGYFALGNYETVRGNWIDAELNYRKALQLQPEIIQQAGIGFNMAVMYMAIGHYKKSSELIEELIRNDPLDRPFRRLYIVSLSLLGNIQGLENEVGRGKLLFGDEWETFIGWAIVYHRLGTGDPVSLAKTEDYSYIFNAVKEHLDSPKEGLSLLHQLYSDEDNLSEVNITDIALFAAYFGDPDFAIDAMERGVKIHARGLFKIWYPVMKKVRQLPRFKEFVREIGLVEYWNEFGWPDTNICRPVGDDDFVCD